MGTFYRLNALGYALPAAAHVVAPAEADALAAAGGLLTAAEAKAAGIVASAEDAYARECERGYRDGLTQAQLAAAERLLQESRVLDDALRAVEAALAVLLVGCLRQIVDGFDDVAIAEAVLRAAMKRMRREKRAELRVSPEQLAHFKAAIGAIVAEYPEIELVDVVEDTELTAPHVILESSIGRVEGDLGARLDAFEQILRGVVPAQAVASAESEAA